MQKKNTITSQRAARTFLLGAAISGLLLTAGCAELPKTLSGASQQTPEQAVTARSEARAAAFEKKDMKAVYSFMTPAYRQRVSEERYVLTHPQRFTLYAAKVAKVTCESDSSCKVDAAWTYKTNFNMPGVRTINVGKITNVLPEHWVKIDGQWWYYIKE